MRLKRFFKFGFIILTCFIILDFVFVLTILLFNNPLRFSWHPDFFSGLFFGITYFGAYYYGWLNKE